MKKIIATILAIFYLGTSFGATVHFHYCMDELVSWGLESRQDKQCSNCGMDKSESQDGCCKDDQQQLKGEDDQKITVASFNFNPVASFASIVRFFEYKLSLPVTAFLRPHLNESPPGKSLLPVYLRNRVFLI